MIIQGSLCSPVDRLYKIRGAYYRYIMLLSNNVVNVERGAFVNWILFSVRKALTLSSDCVYTI